MSAPSFDERPHADALAAAIKAQFGPWECYEHGEVPGLDGNAGSIPDIFALVQVSRRYLPTQQAVRRASRTAWRASIHAVGRTADECRWAMNRISLALDSQRLAVSGRASTPIQHETSDDPGPDGGRFSALVRFTYTL